MTSILRLAQNLRYLRLRAHLTQEQMAEIAGFDFKFYQKLEGGRKPQLKIETVERLGRPFGLEAWQLLSPQTMIPRAKMKIPTPRTPAPRGPRAKWKGEAKL